LLRKIWLDPRHRRASKPPFEDPRIAQDGGAHERPQEALEDYRGGSGDFAGYVIGRRGLEAGCEHTATFDRRLKTSALFQVLPA